MNKIKLRTDANGRTIQSLTPAGTPSNGTIGGSSVRITIPTNSSVVRVSATGNCFVAFGDSTVVATTSDVLFPAGVEVFSVDPSWTHVAFIQAGAATGEFGINEMQ